MSLKIIVVGSGKAGCVVKADYLAALQNYNINVVSVLYLSFNDFAHSVQSKSEWPIEQSRYCPSLHGVPHLFSFRSEPSDKESSSAVPSCKHHMSSPDTPEPPSKRFKRTQAFDDNVAAGYLAPTELALVNINLEPHVLEMDEMNGGAIFSMEGRNEPAEEFTPALPSRKRRLSGSDTPKQQSKHSRHTQMSVAAGCLMFIQLPPDLVNINSEPQACELTEEMNVGIARATTDNNKIAKNEQAWKLIATTQDVNIAQRQ